MDLISQNKNMQQAVLLCCRINRGNGKVAIDALVAR